AGWLQTTSNPADIGAGTSGQTYSGRDFGVFQKVSISGLLFQDTDGGGTRESGDPGLSGRTVYLDANGNGTLDTGETSTTSDSSGNYSFSGLGPGTYRVRQALPAGWLQTTADPAAIQAQSGSNVAGLDFGAFQKVTLSGVLFEDTDGDGA